MKRFIISLITLFLLVIYGNIDLAFAGSDIQVSCNSSTCTVTPDAIPLFSEGNIWPGYTVSQQLTATNMTQQSGEFGIDLSEVKQKDASSIAEKILIEIHEGNVDGAIVYGGGATTLKDLFDAGQVTLGTIDASQSKTYVLKAIFDPKAGNEYMGIQTAFNLEAGFVFTGRTTPSRTPTPTGRPSRSNDSSGGSSGGGTSGPSNFVCSDTPPTGAPVLTAVIPSGSQVTLNWTAVPGVTHYAINFGVEPGVFIYGASNVGNNTSFTVEGVQPGVQYFFQIIPVNGCAPGPRSTVGSTDGTLLPAGAAVPAPSGFSQTQVLGEETDASDEEKRNGEDGEKSGEVLGEKTCEPWKPYLPLIFIALQLISTFVIYALMRSPDNRRKHAIVLVIDLILTGVFYYLRNCDCAQQTFFSLLCQWYFVLAISAALVAQFVNYALIEREE